MALVGDQYKYTASDGTVVMYATTSPLGYPIFGYSCHQLETSGACYIPISVTKPGNVTYAINWDYADICQDTGIPQPDCPSGYKSYYRMAGVQSSRGYGFSVGYLTNAPGTSLAPVPNWYKKTGVAFSNALTSCGASCPTVSYGYPATNMITITDGLNRQWRLTTDAGLLLLNAIKRPGSTSDSTTYTYSGSTITVAQAGIGTWTYNIADSGNMRTMTVTDPLAHVRTITSDIALGRPKSVKDALNHTTSYDYDTKGRLTKVTAPELNFVTYTPDDRGNITSTVATPKPGSPLSAITTSATFQTPCVNRLTCNKPLTSTDPRGKVTEYEYDPTHGGITKLTAPAPSSGAARPEVRYSYTQLDANGAPSGSSGMWELTGVSTCRAGSAPTCVGTVDETRQVVGYGTNLLPISSEARSGNTTGTGALSAVTTYGNDTVGNVISRDGPLPGSADTTRYFYDVGRRQTGVVGPDPDGAGALKFRAIRTTYNADSQVTLSEQGTTTNQADPWPTFARLFETTSQYDATAGRLFRTFSDTPTSGTITVTDYGYDGAGKPECTILRMNPAAYGSLPGPCTPSTTGTFGPDRTTKVVYDAADRVTKVQTAVGTSVGRDDQTNSYTGNDLVQTVADGKGNLTTYEYDGFDRLSKTFYPNKTGGGSSATDYEQLVYDAASNVTQRLLRDDEALYFGYDDLNRPTYVQTNNLNPADGVAYFAYDSFGRVTSTSRYVSGVATVFVGLGYDALGRPTYTSNAYGGGASRGRSSLYDLAGRRTRLTWSDGFYVTYDYLTTDEMTVIRENGTTSGVGVLATFAYNDLGQRTGLTRGNGTSTSYGYDASTRLNAIGLNHPSIGVAYGYTSYNPASQIGAKSTSNDAYAFRNLNVNRSYTVNGLNQYTQAGDQAPTYDGRGNTIGIGSATFTYTALNQLSTGGGSAYRYDPLGHLVSNSGASQQYDYDGDQMVTEVDTGGSLLRRYVFGPGIDEPLVWYEGSTTANRRFLAADERGSIVQITDSAGNSLAINSYNDFGAPASTNVGRFQYTGQAWLPEVGLYYYKARMYNPALGRFMQTDPIGYADGLNMYNYVGGDPVNRRDPLGLATCEDIGRVTLTPGYIFSGEDKNGPYSGVVAPQCGSSIPHRAGPSYPYLSLGSSTGAYFGNPFAGFTAKYNPRSICEDCNPTEYQGGSPQKDTNTCRPVSSGNTVQVGLSGQGTFGIFSYQIAVGVAFDSHGNVALYGTLGPGGGVGGGGAAGLSLQGSNAPTVQDLGGFFTNGSGGGGLGIGGTVDGFGGYARNGQPIVGEGVTAGAAGGETSFGGVTDTFVSPSLNLLGRPTC